MKRLKRRFSNPIQPGEIEAAYAEGMLRKSDLEDGAYYRGYCRNAQVAMWSAEKNKFLYMRQKFTMRFVDAVEHPEDARGYDLFIAFEKTEPSDEEMIVKGKQV